ncbi:MAG: DeoR/GlpR family DNA-binding transcription regulator [Treponema sp.]|jgi:DeoR family glycerol-3-phosphate regulon repressor|nr:DeoR/GlpR family DNA-binding transcription regulator [Treponema sp.]
MKSFAQDRRNNIVEMVNRNGQVRVKDLSEKFKVTEDCIRKDLAILEGDGLLSRLYGGAVKIRVNPHEFNVSQRLDKNTEIKQKIALKAFSLIHEGDTVFLDISTSNAQLSRLIAESNLKITVVTNMVEVMLNLSVPCPASLILVGGSFSPGKDGFIGAAAISVIEPFRFDLAFMGVVGVDLYGNRVETYLVDDGLTKEAVMQASRKKYMLLETQKFNNTAPYKYARIDDFTGMITEEPLPDSINKALEQYKLEVI